MEKGKLLGSGVTAQVYEWGTDKILKLYFEIYSTIDQVNCESKIACMVREAGINTPAVFDIIEIDDRKGIVFERVQGKNVSHQLIKEPWNLFYFVQQMAALQHNIHRFSANGLQTQTGRFKDTINISSHILGSRIKRILDYVESLPDGNSICHGDLYFNNIIMSGNKFVPIDWNGAYRGNPLSDVVRSAIMICSPAVPIGIPEEVSVFYSYPKLVAYWVYINEYIKLAKVGYEDIDQWQLPVAAARLKDNIRGEKNWLMDIIDKRLVKL